MGHSHKQNAAAGRDNQQKRRVANGAGGNGLVERDTHARARHARARIRVRCPVYVRFEDAVRRHRPRAGQTILQLLNEVAGVAEENSRHAMAMAQKLSHQLRAAENRIAGLEAEVASHQGQAERAEQWLHKVYTEIEDRFLHQDQTRRGVPQRR